MKSQSVTMQHFDKIREKQENLLILEIRQKLTELLSHCSSSQRETFRRMYNHKGLHENDVDGVTVKQLDWAFYQLEQTIMENQKTEIETLLRLTKE